MGGRKSLQQTSEWNKMGMELENVWMWNAINFQIGIQIIYFLRYTCTRRKRQKNNISKKVICFKQIIVWKKKKDFFLLMLKWVFAHKNTHIYYTTEVLFWHSWKCCWWKSSHAHIHTRCCYSISWYPTPKPPLTSFLGGLGLKIERSILLPQLQFRRL